MVFPNSCYNCRYYVGQILGETYYSVQNCQLEIGKIPYEGTCKNFDDGSGESCEAFVTIVRVENRRENRKVICSAGCPRYFSGVYSELEQFIEPCSMQSFLHYNPRYRRYIVI